MAVCSLCPFGRVCTYIDDDTPSLVGDGVSTVLYCKLTYLHTPTSRVELAPKSECLGSFRNIVFGSCRLQIPKVAVHPRRSGQSPNSPRLETSYFRLRHNSIFPASPGAEAKEINRHVQYCTVLYCKCKFRPSKSLPSHSLSDLIHDSVNHRHELLIRRRLPNKHHKRLSPRRRPNRPLPTNMNPQY